MAYINTTIRPALADRIRATIDTIRAARAKRAVYLRTMRELEALSDRDLADLGISRLSIEDLAWKHAYGE